MPKMLLADRFLPTKIPNSALRFEPAWPNVRSKISTILAILSEFRQPPASNATLFFLPGQLNSGFYVAKNRDEDKI